jgi:hypothetical protein
MDLPLATLELDHDALRENLSSFSVSVRDGGYSPPPTGSWQPIFFLPRKAVCTSTSTVTRQHFYHLLTKTMPSFSYAQNDLISQFFHKLEKCTMLFSLLKISLSTLLPRKVAWVRNPTNYLFLSFLSKVAWVLNPSSWSCLEILQMGTLSHLLINSLGGLFHLPL